MIGTRGQKSGVAVSLFLTGSLWMLVGCSPGTPNSSTAPSNAPAQSSLVPAPSSAETNLTPLFRHIWRVTKAPTKPPLGSILIFLPNGTLLETSCVETYRIAAWSADKNDPRKFSVVEDRQPAYNAAILELNDATLRFEQQLIRSKEKQELTFSAVNEEFVCPDLPK
jgi:hypothetical protein